MRKFEYQKFHTVLWPTTEELNKLGSEGWELCEILETGCGYVSILKRELLS